MIGERIRQARLAAGLTQDEVVAQLGKLGLPLTKAALSKYETGKSVPKAVLMLKLSSVLKVQSSYFVTEPGVVVEWKAFRRHSQLPAAVQKQVKGYAETVAEHQLELQTLLYPTEQVNFPPAQPVDDFDSVEAAAECVRERWALGDRPVESFVQTVEDCGAVVVKWEANAGRFDGLSGWGNGEIPIIVINTAVDLDRRRFNLAHEIGHLVMDCDDATPDKEQEQLAHRFAAAFLVPAVVARRELGNRRRHLDFDELGLLKQKYGLSIQAWIRRAKDLAIITEGHYEELFRELSVRGWRTSEPNRFIGVEEPTRFKQMVLRALAEGIIDHDRARQICPDCLETKETPIDDTRVSRISAREILKLPLAERERIVQEAFDQTADQDIEYFDVYSEADFDDK